MCQTTTVFKLKPELNRYLLMSLILAFITLIAMPLKADETFEDQLKVYDRDEVHSIHKKLYTKQGRHEITLGVGGILNNDGYALLQGSYTYHLFENLALEAGLGGMGFQFGDDNKLFLYQASVAFSPLYGKMSLFTWSVVNFDIFVVGGAGAVSYSGLNDGSSFMGNIGVGERIFINEFLSFKLEYRDFMYKLSSATSSKIVHNHTLLGGISLFIPMRQKY